jgi:hypothetical protein
MVSRTGIAMIASVNSRKRLEASLGAPVSAAVRAPCGVDSMAAA